MIGKLNYTLVIDINQAEQHHSNWIDQVIKHQNIFLPPSSEFEETAESIQHTITEKEADIDYRISNITLTMNAKNQVTSLNEPLKAKYMGYGVVRLFREFHNNAPGSRSNAQNNQQDDTSKRTSSSIEYVPYKYEREVNLDDETTVAIVAIPSYFTPTDIVGFIGANHATSLTHIRLINSLEAHGLVALMKFRTRETARAFHEEFNGKEFNPMESEVCHVVFIKSVIFRPLNMTSSTSSNIPYLLEDPFTSLVKKSDLKNDSLEGSETIVKELPTCPVCLERMDSDISGLLTISCQHTFHCSCLSKWKDDTCPVCRYSSFQPNSELENTRSQGAQCSVCERTQNLWICLICGNVGCGRYDSKHAISHYEKTDHCFAMDISTQRVWDYAGDNYVHRLLQNESDGKLVELPESATDSQSDGVHSPKNSKDGELQREEYMEILLSQLESQREYYESRLSDVVKSYDDRLAQIQNKLGDVSIEELNGKFKDMESKLAGANHKSDEVTNYEKEIKRLKPLLRKLERSCEEEKFLSENLSKNLEELKLENSKLKEEKEDLSAQVNDLMFYLESQEKFKDASDDVKNGTILVQENPAHTKKIKKKNKGGKK